MTRCHTFVEPGFPLNLSPRVGHPHIARDFQKAADGLRAVQLRSRIRQVHGRSQPLRLRNACHVAVKAKDHIFHACQKR